MLGRVMRGVGYSAWFILALLFFTYLAFPNERVKSFAEAKASAALKMKVRIGELKLRGLGGVTLNDVKIEIPIPPDAPPGPPDAAGGPHAAGGPNDAPPPSAEAVDGGKDKPDVKAEQDPNIINPPGIVMASEIRLDVNAFGLAFGKPLKASVKAEISGGTVSGAKFEKTADGWDLAIETIDGINLAPTRLFKLLLKSDINSLLSGKLDMHWGGSLAQSRGKFDFSLGETVVPHLVFKDPASGYMAAEAFNVQVGQIDFKATLDKRGNFKVLGGQPKEGPATLLIEKFQAKGAHLTIDLDSKQSHTITFGPGGFGDATIDVKIVISFTDEFYRWKGDGRREDGSEVKDASHEGLRQALEGPMSPLRNARIRQGKGFEYGYHCRGPVKHLKCTPEAPSRRITPRFDNGPGTPPPPPDGSGGGEGRPEALNRPAPPPHVPASAGPMPDHPLPPPLTGRPTPHLVEPGRPASERIQPQDNPAVTRRAGYPEPGVVEPPSEDQDSPTPLPDSAYDAEPTPEPPAEGEAIPANSPGEAPAEPTEGEQPATEEPPAEE